MDGIEVQTPVIHLSILRVEFLATMLLDKKNRFEVRTYLMFHANFSIEIGRC
jgi:hypothetical protein